MILIMIFWLLSAAVCCYLAERKGRNKVIGFLLGFLFGVFAVIGYLIVGKKA